MVIIFDSCYYTDWIANTEIGLDPNNSVIKRLWCIVEHSSSRTIIDLGVSMTFLHIS